MKVCKFEYRYNGRINNNNYGKECTCQNCIVIMPKAYEKHQEQCTYQEDEYTWNVTLERDVTVDAKTQEDAEEIAKIRFGGIVTGSWKADDK